jgi:hypothetical protein
MPFRDHADSFAPEALEVMTAVFNTVMKSSPRPLTTSEGTALAQCIAESAAYGALDIGMLTRIALSQLAHVDLSIQPSSYSDRTIPR